MADPDVTAALIAWMNLYVTAEDSEKVTRLAQLGDGVLLSDILSVMLPEHFSSEGMRRAQNNWVLRRANVDQLLTAIDSYVQEEHRVEFESKHFIDSSRIANPAACDENMVQVLCEIVFTLCVAGSKEALLDVRKIDKAHYQLLQGVARNRVMQHGFRKPSTGPPPRRDSTLHTDPTVEVRRASPPPSTQSGIRVFGENSSDPATLLKENQELSAALRSAESKLTKLQGTMTLEHEELTQLQLKYDKLIEESTKGKTRRERELLDKLEEKESRIADLTSQLEDAQNALDALRTEKEQEAQEKTKLETTFSEIQQAMKGEQTSKEEVYAQLVLAQDRLARQMNRTEELEKQLWGMSNSQKTLDAEKKKISREVSALQSQIEEKMKDIQRLEADLEEERERRTTAENAGGMAANLELSAGAKREDLASTVERLKEQLTRYQDLDLARREELAELRNKLAEQQAQPVAPANDDEVSRLKKEVETLETHLRHAVEELHSKGHAEEALLLQRENEQLRERIEVGRTAIKREQAAIFAEFFECGQRNMQLQMRQLLGESPIPTSDLFAPLSELKTTKLSFLEKHRRSVERGMLRNLAASVQARR